MTVFLHANTQGGGGGTSSAPDVQTTRGQATSVPINAETTVVQRVVPLGYTMKLHGLVPSGNADAEWFLYDDATEVFRFRRAVHDHEPFTWANPISVTAGHTLSLRVVHQTADQIAGSTTRNFYGALIFRDA
jgi:hypothetical protein